MALSQAARALLESAALAHLVTINADGSPAVAVVWVGLEGNPPPGFVTRITVDRIGGVGAWEDAGE